MLRCWRTVWVRAIARDRGVLSRELGRSEEDRVMLVKNYRESRLLMTG